MKDPWWEFRPGWLGGCLQDLCSNRAVQLVHLPVPHETGAGRMRLTSLRLPFCATSGHPAPCGHMTVPLRSSKCASPKATADNEAVQDFKLAPPQAALNAIHACSKCTCPTLSRAAPHLDPPWLFLFSDLFLLARQRQVVER